ncbi:MAG: adenosylcobinamide-phosphate synthase CbiB [Kiritimatiellae bacterium]|nr:adenosylcobinamide-phosphate synthase CbiB [Kiritimatiellia bacterium]
MNTAAIVLLAAGALDWLLGDPVYAAHPVRLLGQLIGHLDRALRRRFDGIGGGLLLVLMVWLAALVSYLAPRLLMHAIHPWLAWTWDVFVVYSCLALKDMIRHARPIAAALDAADLATARALVGRIVGRDPAALDAAGVARAAVESVAESFVDGFLAPVCWFAAGCWLARWWGLPATPVAVGAALLYRTSNTMDSMVGYRDETYILFGRAAARLDDAMNFIPARLSLPVLTLAAALGGLNAVQGWRTGWRDRLKHASPNSAHAESVVAGAQGLCLGGPTRYADGLEDKPWLGDGTADANAGHVGQVCRLVTIAGALTLLLAAGAILSCV